MGYYGAAKNSKQWGAREDRLLLNALPAGQPFLAQLPTKADKKADVAAAVSDAVKKAKLAMAPGAASPTGKMDEATRKWLIQQYMVASGPEEWPADAQVTTIGRANWHRVQETENDDGKSGRCAENRRVEIFHFEVAGDEPVKPALTACDGHGGSGDKGSCTAYDRWLSKAKEKGRAVGGAPTEADGEEDDEVGTTTTQFDDGRDHHFLLVDEDGSPRPDVEYELVTASGKKISGKTDANGLTEKIDGSEGEEVTLHVFDQLGHNEMTSEDDSGLGGNRDDSATSGGSP
jgi:hypothetical protein